MSQQQEIWKDIPGFEEIFQMNQQGIVKNKITGEIKIPYKSKPHLSQVYLSSKTRSTNLSIIKYLDVLFDIYPKKKVASLDGEKWIKINYTKYYWISSVGRLKNEKTGILNPSLSGGGYLSGRFRLITGLQIKYLIHRLVAQAFIPNPENKPFVNHINGIKTDNRIENLEWVTASENLTHALRTGLKSQKGEKSPSAKFSNKEILEIRGKYDSKKYSIKELADIFNVGYGTIYSIVKRINWKHL